MRETTTFPSDIDACHRLLRGQRGVIAECHTAIAERDVVIAERDTALAAKAALVAQQNQQLAEQKDKLAEYQPRLAAALQAAFKKRIERNLADPSQLKIDFGDSPDVADAAEGLADAAYENIEGYRRRQQQPQKTRNEQLPAHLPRIEVKLPVPEDQKTCPEHGEREVIGYDWQETLEIVPPKLVVRRTGIPKLACRKHEEGGVKEALRPVGLVEGNRYGTSVAAQIVVHKYGFHLRASPRACGRAGASRRRSTSSTSLSAAIATARSCLSTASPAP